MARPLHPDGTAAGHFRQQHGIERDVIGGVVSVATGALHADGRRNRRADRRGRIPRQQGLDQEGQDGLGHALRDAVACELLRDVRVHDHQDQKLTCGKARLWEANVP